MANTIKSVTQLPFKTLTSREFNQHASEAKQAANEGPVVITDRGRPAHVLLTYEEYQRLAGTGPSIVDMLSMPEAGKIEFEPPRATGFSRPADFS